MKKSIWLILAMALLLFVLSACNATSVDVADCASQEPAGFWLGLWHGIIAPFAFIVSLFNDSVAVYEVVNNGGWYDFGFVMGASIIFGGSGNQARPRRKKRD